MTTNILNITDFLKPCPFCGREVVLVSDSIKRVFIFSHANLRSCPFYTFEMSWECAQSIKEAKTLWNRRRPENE